MTSGPEKTFAIFFFKDLQQAPPKHGRLSKIFVFAPNFKSIPAIYLEFTVYVIIVISFHN